ncbi:MAG: acetate kinase, partial [Blastococcus sp.]
MRVLVVNAGSSSLKLAVLDAEGCTTAEETVQRWEGEGHLEPLTAFLDGCGPVDAVGHRVVHGGPRHDGPVPVDDAVLAYLASISHLAPLHNPRALAAIRSVATLLPGVPAVACFDTTFHATLPPAARTYAVPREWNERFGLRRYGFHGLSHA